MTIAQTFQAEVSAEQHKALHTVTYLKDVDNSDVPFDSGKLI